MIRGKNIIVLMDSHLEGKFSTEDARVVVNLASQCLQYEPKERPNTKDLLSTLSPLQPKCDVRNWNCPFFFFSTALCFWFKRHSCISGSISCDAWNFQARGSSAYPKASSIPNGRGLFKDGSHGNSSDSGHDTLSG